MIAELSPPVMKHPRVAQMLTCHPAFDWSEVAYLTLLSRTMDELEETEGFVRYQFSAKGHELPQVLLSQRLNHPFDAATVYYRSRPFVLGSGLTPTEAFISGLARSGSMSNGRDVGVTSNLPRRNRATVLPMAGDVGAQYTPAVGWAQAIRYRVEQLGETHLDGSIAVAFGGEGSVAANGFWAMLNIVTTLKLPVLVVIEDNGYAISVKSPLQTPGSVITENLAAFKNLKIWDGSGTNPHEAATLIDEAVNTVRSGVGPGLLRLTVPRLSGHTGIDTQTYKTEAERQQEQANDPIPALHDYLVPSLMNELEWEALLAQVKDDVIAAKQAAFQQPEAAVQTVTHHVWHDPTTPAKVGGLAAEGITLPTGSDTPQPTQPTRLNMIEAIRRTMESELKFNQRAVIFGEDVGFKGGVHAATLGLQKEFGEARVFDTSLSEEGIIGRAVGMALAGLMPVPEIQFRKYADPATEQLNNCGTLRWRTNNNFAAPIVVRMPGGYRKVGDPWHSVTSEITFAHAVGWKLAVPSNAEDAVGLLRTALRGNDPTIFFEHRALLDGAWARRPYPGDDFMVPYGQANIVTHGDALTVVTWGAMVELCEQAAKALKVEVDIIDLRTLVPWDEATVLASVRKTSKCLVVHEDIGFGGFGAEIVATIVDKAFMDLDAPVQRVTAPAVPVPYSPVLMAGVVPTVERIQATMKTLIEF